MVVKRVYDNLSTLKAQKENGDPIGDEGERRTAVHLEGVPGVVSGDEYRDAEGWHVAPVALERVVLLRTVALVEHPSAHHDQPTFAIVSVMP